jgi:hypothetical protein
MAANRTSQDLVERLVDGFLQYDYTEVWQVDASGPAAALQDASLPTIGTQYAISGVSQPVYCYQRQPRRRSDTQAKSLFDVICSFTNAVTRYERTVDGLPANEPEQIVPRVDVTFEEYNDTKQSAYFVGVFSIAQHPSEYTPEGSFQTPSYMKVPGYDYEWSIINSANEPFGNVNVSKHTKRITYWSWHRDWETKWDDWLDVVNSEAVTITQRDKEGERLKYDFKPFQLLIKDIVKEDHWRDGRLYFRRGIVFSFKEDCWFYRRLDEGLNERIYEGQYKPDGTQVTASDMTSWFGSNASTYEQIPVTFYRPADDTGPRNEFLPVAPSEPQVLNGWGRLNGVPTPYDNGLLFKYIAYMPYRLGDFNELGIT